MPADPKIIAEKIAAVKARFRQAVDNMTVTVGFIHVNVGKEVDEDHLNQFAAMAVDACDQVDAQHAAAAANKGP